MNDALFVVTSPSVPALLFCGRQTRLVVQRPRVQHPSRFLWRVRVLSFPI